MCTVLLPPAVNPNAVNKYVVLSSLHLYRGRTLQSPRYPVAADVCDKKGACFEIFMFSFWSVLKIVGPPLWSSGQSFWLQIQRSRVRFPALPDFSE